MIASPVKSLSKMEDRKSLMNALNLRTNAILHTLENFQGRNDHNITKTMLKGFPDMVWVMINEGVKVRKRGDLFKDTLVFDTIIAPGGQFGLHLHSDCIEHCDVIRGELIDLATNQTFQEGETVVFEKGDEHLPMSNEYTQLRVYFR